MAEGGTRTSRRNAPIRVLFTTDALAVPFGTIRVSLWPEGLVLWVGGQIRWKSWEEPEFAKTANAIAVWDQRGGGER